MANINFKPHSAALIDADRKHQAPRRERAIPIIPGETIHLWCRSEGRKLGTAECIAYIPIKIDEFENIDLYQVCEWIRMDSVSRTIIATGGGLSVKKFFSEMRRVYGLPFQGVLIKWGKITHGEDTDKP